MSLTPLEPRFDADLLKHLIPIRELQLEDRATALAHYKIVRFDR